MATMLTARHIFRHTRLFARANSTKAGTSSSIIPKDDTQDKELMPEVPIKGLDLVSKIQQVEKKGSFSVDLFNGGYDADFLIYPEPVDTRLENIKIKQQMKMVCQMWPQIWDDPLELQKYNFFNLYQLSVSEMMTIFEAIGKSSRKSYEVRIPALRSIDYNALPHQVAVSKVIIDLITRNCLTYWPLHVSENYRVKEVLPKKHIVFGEPQPTDKLYPKIGFCWTEKAPTLGSLPPQEWQTLGSHGGPANDYYLLKGKKNGILYDGDMEHFLVFFKDKFLSEKAESEGPVNNEPNPASDPYIGSCLVHKSQITQGEIYTDSAGFNYTDVEIDATIPGAQSVFNPEPKNPHGLNIKALGQIATCSVVVGMLKDTLNMAYQYLFEHKEGLVHCDIIQRKLIDVTTKIFAIESMVYYIAGMYDGLKPGFDAHVEATICKIVTNEFAYDCLQELQRVFGSDMFIVSKLQDQINIFDSFLDGNIYNRLYLSTMGILWYARSQNTHLNMMKQSMWYPGYATKALIRERMERGGYLKLDADIHGNLHPSLSEAAGNLEFIARRVSFAADAICKLHGGDATACQSALYEMAQLSIDTFMLTTMCARASKTYCNGSRYAELDVVIATHFSRQFANRTRMYLDDLSVIDASALNLRAKQISEANIKLGGYYAESPMDPNI